MIHENIMEVFDMVEYRELANDRGITGMRILQISDLATINQNEIMFVHWAESGAMGEAGEIKIVAKQNECVNVYLGNYVCGNLYIEQIRKEIPLIDSFIKSGNVITGWKYEYLGMGNHLFVKDTIYDDFRRIVGDAVEEELYTVYMGAVEKVLEPVDSTSTDNICAYNLIWTRKELTPQKLGKFSEYYTKMVLTSYGMSIYTSEVDDHGIDFIAETPIGYLKFQVKSARLNTKYVFMKREYFDISDNTLYLLLVLLSDGKHPKVYMIPTSAWHNPVSKLFVYHAYDSKSEYGVNLSDKNKSELEKYRIDKVMKSLGLICSEVLEKS